MSRKRPYEKKAFESSGAGSDTSANVYLSMLLSPAWKALTANQKCLYLYCKAQYYGEKRKPNNDAFCFTMNRSKWADLYGLYGRDNAVGFRRDISALIMHGFIVCVECGASTRTKSIYKFSDMWQRYGTSDFEVSACDMTAAMLRKERNKKP